MATDTKTPRRQWLITGLWLAICLLAITGLASRPSHAQNITANGISVSPAVMQLELKAGQGTLPFSVKVTNNNTSPVNLQVSSLDFRSLNETGGLTFLGTAADQLQYRYGLASWITIPNPVVALAPGETKTVNFVIENRADLAPGGHYAAVLFKSATSSVSSNANPVAINQVVSSLIFLRKTDGAVYSLKLQSVLLDRNFLKLPRSITTTFYDDGNVQTAPRGYITLTNPLSHEVGRAILNPESSLVLPETSRQITSSFTNLRRSWLPGRYTANIHYRADGNSNFTTVRVTFWYINLWPILLTVGVIVLIILALKKLKVVKKTKRLFNRLQRR